jgi:hypothetical protein
MPTPTPTFIKKKPKPSSYPYSSKPWDKKYGYGTASKTLHVKAPKTLARVHPRATFGPPGGEIDRKYLSDLSKSNLLVCPATAVPPFEHSLPIRLPQTTEKPCLVLNPAYRGPGLPRFSVIYLMAVFTEEGVMEMYHLCRKLTMVTAPLAALTPG